MRIIHWKRLCVCFLYTYMAGLAKYKRNLKQPPNNDFKSRDMWYQISFFILFFPLLPCALFFFYPYISLLTLLTSCNEIALVYLWALILSPSLPLSQRRLTVNQCTTPNCLYLLPLDRSQNIPQVQAVLNVSVNSRGETYFLCLSNYPVLATWLARCLS